MFTDSFQLNDLEQRNLENDTRLAEAYRGTGIFQLASFYNGDELTSKFTNAIGSLNNPTDIKHLESILPATLQFGFG
jgi:hypothetical protein